MGRRWIPVGRQGAEAHPLYGVRGWLLAILVLHSLGLLLVLVTQGADLLRIARRIGIFFELDIVLGLLMVGLLQLVVLQAYMLYLGFLRQPGFRAWALVLMVLSIALDLGLMLYLSAHGGAHDPDSLLIDFLQIGISLATLAYLAVSRRVRVTYQWLVSADDPALAAVTQPPPAPPGAPWLERYLQERP
jgi:hypothetical protein